MTHAFFKALLFLGAGSVIHAMSNEQDMTKMGGLKKYLPTTYWTFLLATLAISGIPFFSGFFSKDEILWKSFSSLHGHPLFWVVGVATAGMTAFYMFRLVYLTFHGKERMDDATRKKIHESPRSMTVPLIVLAVLSVVGGYVGMPHIFGVTNYFEEWLAPVIAGHDVPSHALASTSGGGAGTELLLMVLSVVLVLMAIFTARLFYNKKPELATSLRGKLSRVHSTLQNKYYVDEIYAAVIVHPLIIISIGLWKVVDVIFIDGFINAAALLYDGISQLFRHAQTGRLRSYVSFFAIGVVCILGWLVMR